MNAATTQSFRDPLTGMDLVPLPANLVSMAAGPATFPQIAQPTSLTRMPELERFLCQCNDPSYKDNYYQLLQGSPPTMLLEFLGALMKRASWLSGEEQREMQITLAFKRARKASAARATAAARAVTPTAHHMALPNPIRADPFSTTPSPMNSVPITAVGGQLLIASHGPPPSIQAMPQTVPQDVPAKRSGRPVRQSTLKRKYDDFEYGEA